MMNSRSFSRLIAWLLSVSLCAGTLSLLTLAEDGEPDAPVPGEEETWGGGEEETRGGDEDEETWGGEEDPQEPSDDSPEETAQPDQPGETPIPDCPFGSHSFVLEAGGVLTCSACGVKTNVASYTGLYTDESGLRYSTKGNLAHGWLELDGNWYYFSGVTKYAVALNGEQVIDGYHYRFENYILVEGEWYTTESGDLILRWAGKRHASGWFEYYGHTYCCSETGVIYTGHTVVRLRGEEPVYAVFDDKGVFDHAVTDGLFVSPEEVVYLVGNVPVPAGVVRDAEDNLYYINSTGKAVKGQFGIQKDMTNGLLLPGTYEFGPDFKLIIKNGIGSWGDSIYYYIDSIPQPMGLVRGEDGFYYYFHPQWTYHNAVKNRDLTMTQRMTGGLFPPGVYHFDEYGHMVIPEEPATEPETEPVSEPETKPADPPETEPATTPAETTRDPEVVTAPGGEVVTTPEGDPVTKPVETVVEPETIVTPVTTPEGEVVTTPEGEIVTKIETIPVTSPVSDEPTQPGETGKAPGGCKSSAAAGAALLSLIAAAGLVSLRRKKD